MTSRIPLGWDEVPLGQLGKYINGRAFKPSEWETSGSPIIRIQNLNDPSKPYNYYSGRVDENFYVRNGDLLIAWSASLGAFIWDDGDAILNQHIFRVEVNEGKVTKKFLFYAIKHSLQDIMSQTHGMGMKHITKGKFEAIKVPVPRSLAEQRRIVARLDALLSEVREMRELAQSMQEDIGRVMESALAEVFPNLGQQLSVGWAWKPLNWCSVDTERRNPSRSPNAYFRYIEISSIDNTYFSIIPEKVRTIIGRDAPSRARKVVHSNDIIFATTRPYLKNIALVPPELNNEICSTGFCVLRPIAEKIAHKYLYYAVRTQGFIKQILPKQRGANYPAVADRDIFEGIIPIPYPDKPEKSLTEQQRIVAHLDAIRDEVNTALALVVQDLQAIDQLEKSILAAAFRGEV